MIESVHNPKIKQARALRRRRVRLRESQLFVEGVRLVGDALASGIDPIFLFFTAEMATHPQVEAWLATYTSQAWDVSKKVMAEMTATITPQGIAAIFPLPHLSWPSEPTFLLVADQLRDPGNLGTLIRSAAAAGVEGLLVPKGTVDPWSDKVLRAGMGAHFRLPIREGLAWEEVLPHLKSCTVRLADANAEISYDAADWSVPSALIVGGEAEGASEMAQRHSDQMISIPMAVAVESLNAAVAGSVILFEAGRQRRESKRNNSSRCKVTATKVTVTIT